MEWSFVIDGDPQIGLDQELKLRTPKQSVVDRILSVDPKPEFILCCGDLTSFGNDSKGPIGCGLLNYKGKGEFEIFLKEYFKPFIYKDITVYCCPGNHDTYVVRPYLRKPVFKWLKDQYGATYSWLGDDNIKGYYMFEKHGVYFICLGIYPKNLTWLKNTLKKLSKKDSIVLFYHYYTIHHEPYGDWWTIQEKEAFYNVIKDYNILLIANGHWHASSEKTWKGIPIIDGAGDQEAIVHMKDTNLDYISWIQPF